MNDRGQFDPPVPHHDLTAALQAIHYNESDAAALVRVLRSAEPAVAALPPDTKAKFIAVCESIVSYRSLHADSLRADRPSMMHGPFPMPDPLRQSHLRQAVQDRASLKTITRQLSERSAKHTAASVLGMQLQMATLDKLASGIIPRPAVLEQAQAFLTSLQRPLTGNDPYALGLGRSRDLPQQLTMKLKQSITAFERLEELRSRVLMKQLGAQREAYIEAFVRAQNAAGRCDLPNFDKHLQTLEHLSSTAKRRSLDRVSIAAT